MTLPAAKPNRLLGETELFEETDICSCFVDIGSFYRAMHFSAFALSLDRMSSVCLSVRL